MPTTTNLSLTLPEPGDESTRGSWGTTLNTAIEGIDSALADATSSTAGRMSSGDKSKLDEIESGATADQTGSEIKSLYEAQSDTNAFTDALLSKLDDIELNAKDDQTGAEIKTLYEAESDTNAFTDSEKTKLSGLIDWTSSGAGTIHSSNIPAIALTNVQEASSQSAQLALTTQEGDVVVRTDENKSYVRNAGTSGSMSDFTLLRTPTDAVQSVNGNTGVVTLTHDGFSDFVANEHIDWTSASAGTIHSTNYTDTQPNATNVNAAGAVMHTDIPDSDTGFLKRTGSETYDVDTNTYLTGNETITVSGDVSGSGTTAITATLANSGVTAATYGSATQVPVIAVDAKGRITSASSQAIQGSSGAAQFYGFRINDYNGDLLLDTGADIGSSYVTTFNVKVVVDQTLQNRFEIDGRDWDELHNLYFKMIAGASYRFDQSDSSNVSHPLAFSTSSDGTTYNPGSNTVTTSGTPGSAGAYTQIDVPSDAPRVLYIKCGSHVNMGGRVEIIGNTNDDFNADATETIEYRKVYRVSEMNVSGLSYSISNTGHLSVTI